MAQHYGVAVVPARARKPRDKAKVESGVLVVERWIVAALRKRVFFSLGELNQAIAELLLRLNQRRFRKREGPRQSRFESLDQPALKPLPVERYLYGEWKTVRVNIDHHVELDRHWYSVPHQLTQCEVELRATPTTVEIFHRCVRIASHAGSRAEYKHTTIHEHRPKAHQRHQEWPPSRTTRTRGWKPPPGAPSPQRLHLRKPEGDSRKPPGRPGAGNRFRATAARRSPQPARARLLRRERAATAAVTRSGTHADTTHPFDALRLHGIAEAFREQQESAELQRLSFEERFGLLTDRQWNWRTSRALDRSLRNARLQGPATIKDINYRTPRGLKRQMVRSLTRESAWVRGHQNLFLLGPTGIGRTWLARAFGQKACRDGYTALFVKAAELARLLATARADGSHA